MIKQKGLQEYINEDQSLIKKKTYKEFKEKQYRIDDSSIEEAFNEYQKVFNKKEV